MSGITSGLLLKLRHTSAASFYGRIVRPTIFEQVMFSLAPVPAAAHAAHTAPREELLAVPVCTSTANFIANPPRLQTSSLTPPGLALLSTSV
jgi:hypothetical protein